MLFAKLCDAWCSLGMLSFAVAVASLHGFPVVLRSHRVPLPLAMALPTGIIADNMTPMSEAVILSPDMTLAEAAAELQNAKITGGDSRSARTRMRAHFLLRTCA